MCICPPILHGLRDLNLLRLQGALPARYVRELQAILAFFVMPICELEEYHRVLSMPCEDGGMMQCVRHSLLREDRRGPPFRALLSCSRRIRELNRQNAAMESGVLVDADLRIVCSFPTQSHPSSPSSSFSSWMWMLETPKKRGAEVLRGLHNFSIFWWFSSVTWHANPLRWPMKSTFSSRQARKTMGMKQTCC